MPVIPQPHVHLKAALDAIDEHQAHHQARIAHHQGELDALDAIDEHQAHHQARIAHHQGELDALEQLRAQYVDVLGQVAPDEPAPVVTAINIIEPSTLP